LGVTFEIILRSLKVPWRIHIRFSKAQSRVFETLFKNSVRRFMALFLFYIKEGCCHQN